MHLALRLMFLVLFLAVAAWALAPPGAWWTGRLSPSRLTLASAGPEVGSVGRVWIDTDAACGAGPRADPDDCFAILWLLERGVDVVGISTSFGNADAVVVTERMAALTSQMRAGGLAVPPVHAGHGQAVDSRPPAEPAGVLELREALAAGPLTVLALGPLTNVVAALERRPDLAGNVRRVVAVMGHEAGHVFHPTEGTGRGVMGHGPIFRDLNVSVDVEAARRFLALDLPLTLIPYDAGRGAVIGAADLAAFAIQGPAQAWLAAQAQGWLAFWQDEVGLDGFYPFDWVAAVWLVAPEMFDCAKVKGEVRLEFAFWVWPRRGMVVEESAGGRTLYCPRTAPGLEGLLLRPK